MKPAMDMRHWRPSQLNTFLKLFHAIDSTNMTVELTS